MSFDVPCSNQVTFIWSVMSSNESEMIGAR